MHIPDSIKKLEIYDWMIISLVVLAGLSLYMHGTTKHLIHILVIPVFALLVDGAIIYAKEKRRAEEEEKKSEILLGTASKRLLSKTALITGLIIALLLNPMELNSYSVSIMLFVPLLAIASKHLIRLRGHNIFNPAAFALILTGLLITTFGSPIGNPYAISWWGASPIINLAVLSIPIALFLGFFIDEKLRRLETSLSFLAVYYVIITAFDVVTKSPFSVIGELFGGASIFFAMFMLIEPKTSPSSKKGMIIFGSATAVLTFVMSYGKIQTDFFLAALLLMNLTTGRLNKIR